MSKNILKDAQERRDAKQSEEGESPDSSTDSVRTALLEDEATDERETKRLNAEIPTGLHERFKDACQSEGTSMTKALTRLVETYVELKGSE